MDAKSIATEKEEEKKSITITKVSFFLCGSTIVKKRDRGDQVVEQYGLLCKQKHSVFFCVMLRRLMPEECSRWPASLWGTELLGVSPEDNPSCLSGFFFLPPLLCLFFSSSFPWPLNVIVPVQFFLCPQHPLLISHSSKDRMEGSGAGAEIYDVIYGVFTGFFAGIRNVCILF